MSKKADALTSCIADLLGAAEHIKAAREACGTLKAQRGNLEAMDDAIGRIEESLAESLFVVLSSPIVLHSILRSMSEAKPH